MVCSSLYLHLQGGSRPHGCRDLPGKSVPFVPTQKPVLPFFLETIRVDIFEHRFFIAEITVVDIQAPVFGAYPDIAVGVGVYAAYVIVAARELAGSGYIISTL